MSDSDHAHDRLPIVAKVDVAIVGGSSGAVACALAAAARGLSVYLISTRAYLGEDIAAAFDYWPASDDEVATALARELFQPDADAPPSPMHVKHTLEQAMVAAHVPFLLNAHPAGVLRDPSGAMAGIVMANRAGRQAIVAGSVVDATDRSLLTRQAGHRFTAWPAGTHTALHVTTGGDPGGDDMPPFDVLQPMVAPGEEEPVEIPARRYRVEVDIADGSCQSLAQAHAEVVERCWRPGVFQQSERLVMTWPDHVDAPLRATDWSGVAAFDTNALAVEDGLHVLGAGAPLSRDVAAALCRPAHLMAVGELLAEAIADEQRAASVDSLTAKCEGSQVIATGEITTPHAGLRPGDSVDETVACPANELPIIGKFDVVVIGGGTGGAGATISAARAGASTLVCENLSVLGGVGTAGQIARYWFGNLVGFTAEMDDGVSALEPTEKLRNDRIGWSPSAKQAWQHREAKKAGAAMWFGTISCGTWVENNCVRGVVVAGPYGFGLVESGAVVDATGCADVAAAAGAPTRAIGSDHVAVQGVGLAYIDAIHPYNNSDHNFSDDTDPVDATAFLVSSKKKFPGKFDCGQLVDSRERRQIIGDISLTPADFLADRRFPDTICVSSSNFDTHGFTVHPVFAVKPPDKQRLWVDVPYRCMLPQGFDGVLVTGLGVSAHRDALPVIRMQGDVQNQGYAAGLAAATAVQQGIGVRDLDVKTLQRMLVEKGNLPDRVLTDEDNFPVSDERLQQAVNSEWDEFGGLALIFEHVERARPLLRDAYDAATDADQKLRYALVLGLMGDAHGQAALCGAIDVAAWDEGWNYTGMGQFGMSCSPIDAMLTALGMSANADAWPTVLAKIESLPDDPQFSHCRAIAEACEGLYARHPDDRAAKALAAVLARDGMGGHAQPTLEAVQAAITLVHNETGVRNVALRELHLARATFRCGDADGAGERVLRAFAADLRGHFARHARAVLSDAGISVRSGAVDSAVAAGV